MSIPLYGLGVVLFCLLEVESVQGYVCTYRNKTYAVTFCGVIRSAILGLLQVASVGYSCTKNTRFEEKY